MSVTGRIIVCLLPSMLFWGGCAAPALLKPKNVGESVTEKADSPQADQSMQPSPMVVAEAALIRQIALEKGFAETDANFYEQSVINAQPEHRQFITQSIYALLNRQGASTANTNEGNPAEPAPVISSLDSAHQISRVGREPQSPDASPDVKVVSHTDHAPLPASQHPAVSASPGSSDLKATEAEKTDANTERVNAAESQSPKTESIGASDSSTNQQKPAKGLSNIETRATHDVTQALETAAANQKAQLKPAAGAEPAGSDAPNQDTPNQDNTDQDDPQLSWQRQLRLAITRLHRHLAEQEELDPLDESRLRACLGLLQLAAEDPEQAMEALDGLDEQQLEFWRQTIMGLDILMDPDDLPKLRYRVESAAEHLQSGLSTLATLGPLRVSNLAFVKAVRGFGTYDEISPHTFSPGEPVLLYVEFGNFTAEQISTDENDGQALRGRRNSGTQVPMFETVLAGRYDILDQNQRVVMSRTLPVIRDHCRQQRHDFFHAYSFDIPQEIASGYYTIELTIEDKKGDKFGSGTVDLKIR